MTSLPPHPRNSNTASILNPPQSLNASRTRATAQYSDMADIKDWMALAEPNAAWEDAVQKMPQRPNLGAFEDIPILRKFMVQSKRALTATFAPIPGVIEKDHQIPSRDGSSITVRVYRPDGKTDCPLVVIFHGGGYCIGGLENEELLCRRAAAGLGSVVLNVDYRLAPEHRFPVPGNDCYDATRWAAANAKDLGADPKKGFIIGGTSAGANLAIGSALQYRDAKLTPAITGCLLMIPPTCVPGAVPEKYRAEYGSWDQNEHADILSRKACDLFMNAYAPNEEDQQSQMGSPLTWKTGLAGFPASYFQICGKDPLRDEGLIFEKALRTDHSVRTKVKVYPGLPHGFHSVIPTLPDSRKYVDDSFAGLEWLLSQH